MSVLLLDITLLDSTEVIRNQTTWADLKLKLTNIFGPSIPEAQDPATNFNITAAYIEHYKPHRTVLEIDYLKVISVASIDVPLNTSLGINTDIFVTIR